MKKPLILLVSMIVLFAMPGFAAMSAERTDLGESTSVTVWPTDRVAPITPFEPNFAPAAPSREPAAGFSPEPEHLQQPSSALFLAFPSQDDYPYRGIPVDQHGGIPRDYAAFGVRVAGLRGGDASQFHRT